EVSEPELAGEEVVELEAQLGRDEGVRPLLVGQADVEADGAAARLAGTAVRRLHDAAATARADHEPARVARQCERPLRDPARELPRVVVVAPERPVLAQPGRAEEDDRVVNPLAPERPEGPQVLG